MKLNLPEYQFKTRVNNNGKREIFDEFRKKYVVLTPEEWVRQNFVTYLKNEKNYPPSLIAIERGIIVNSMKKRFDAVIFNRNGDPKVLIEFKAPDVKINQKVMEQISAYNIKLKVGFLIISNGITHYCCKLNNERNGFDFLDKIPSFDDIV
jgi:hypothetical protein